MNAVKVDDGRRIRLKILTPGDYYEPEVLSADKITLRRVVPPGRPARLTRNQALKAIERSSLRFTRTWDELKKETRG